MAETANTHPHLELVREHPSPRRRSRRAFPKIDPPEDSRRHGEILGERLRGAREAASTALGGYDDRLLIKIELRQPVRPEDIERVSGGVEVVSQEDDTLVLAFATQEQLDGFEARLASLAAGEHVTYARLVYALQDFEHWTPEDRTGWALRRDGFPAQDTFVIDAELWPLAQGSDAVHLRDAFAGWVNEKGGRILDSVKQPYLTVFRIRCELGFAEDLLRHRDVRTADLPPRIGLERELVHAEVQLLEEVPSPPDGAPGIVVLDTGVAAGHPGLEPAVGDTQSFVAGAAADEHGHGTFVSGIALYGEVADSVRSGRFVPQLRLFSGRVLDERNEGDSELIHNQVERAVRYFSETYGCRVFNLSYGDQNKPYQGRHVSGLAATLDALSRELDVLFVVPTGNYEGDEHGPKNWLAEYPDYLKADSSVLLDPAPALNALTVGSLARHERNERWPDDPAYRPVARSDQPSPFTRHGPSVSGAIKPDLVDFGGNMMIEGRAGGRPMRGQHGAGELSTSRDFAVGRPFAEDSGTSFAAPCVANAAARILVELPGASVDLCRALVVAHARTPGACEDLFAGDDDALRDVTGYGLVDRSALYRSLEDCVSLWAEESIEDRRHHFYEIPIPEDFWTGGRRPREITVALAYRPPVRTTRIDYRAVALSFKFLAANSLDEVVRRFDAAVDKKTTVEIKERSSGRRFSETMRSKGSVQASTWVVKQSSEPLRGSSWFVVVTRNDPLWGENLSSERERYALAVTLDDRKAQQLQLTPRLYTQVEARLRARARVTG